jgi:uncharacterized protein (TIGR03437 family)
VAVGPGGEVYVADSLNNMVRKVTPDGKISVVAGTGGAGFSGDGGAATSAKLNSPTDMALDARGSMYIVDQGNQRIRKVDTSGTIQTLAGNGSSGFAGDGGQAVNAALSNPVGVSVDVSGNVLIADAGNNRIRKILSAPPKVSATPSQLQFAASGGGAAPPVQTITFVGDVPGLVFSAKSDSDWLTVSPQSDVAPRLLEVRADAGALRPGTYAGVITIFAPDAVPQSSVINVTFAVSAAQSPKLSIDKESLSFPFPKNGKPRSQPVTISNLGGGSLAFTATAQTKTGGNWLSISPAAGQVTPSTPVTLTVTANPTGLAPGTYIGSLTIVDQTLPVTMTISAIDRAILLSQTGLSYIGVSQGGIVPPQTFGVINIGSGVVNWTVKSSTLSGGPDWLKIGTTSGSTDAAASAVPTVSVVVNPSILPAGKYYGLVQVDAPDAANSPQVVTVFLQVLSAGTDIGAAATPSELLFATTLSARSPGSQDLLLYNIAAAGKSFRSSVTADPGLRVVTLPTEGTLDPSQVTDIVVQPFTDGLAPGVYRGTITLQFSDGRVRALGFSVIVAANGTAGSAVRGAAGVCQPASLLQALTTLGQSFSVTAGYPIGLGVQVTDDCGTPLETGSVTASFSNGDPTVALQPVKGGRWEGTWNTQSKNAAQVTLRLQASDPQGILHGDRQIRGVAEATADPPAFDKRGIVSAASTQQFVPLAPGSIISIYGDRLATATQTYSSTPLPRQMAGTTVTMSGRTLPLYFVSPGQVNAQVPFDLNVNTQHQIQILSGVTASQPIYVDVAPAQPAIFAIVPLQTAVKAGDVIVLFAAGLGAVDPSVDAGAVAGSGGLSNAVNPVVVSVGGQNAQVAFAGLAPGFVGLYQINAYVPNGVPSGNAVPVSISIAGQTSTPATISVQ